MAGLAAALVIGLAPLRAQTVVWVGSANDDFENGANYSGGVAPPTNGADTVQLNSGANSTIDISNHADIYGFYLPGPNGYFNVNAVSGGTLTIGAGGITLGAETEPVVFMSVPVILAANQTWYGSTSGFLLESGGISGNYALTVNGRLYMDAPSSYIGGTEVLSNGTIYIGNNTAAGTGSVTVDSGGTVSSWAGSYTLANATTLQGDATFTTDGTIGQVLGFSGTVTEQSPSAALTVGSEATVVFQGAVAGPAEGTLSFHGTSALLPNDGGSLAVLEGGTTGFTGLSVHQMAVILSPTSSASQFAGLANANLSIQSGGYLGLSGAYTAAGAVSSFLSSVSAVGSTLYGSIGLDSYGTGTTNTFNDNMNLSAFTSEDFLGLGSATSAILYGTITPANQTFKFGGGGGDLIVVSNLADVGGSTGLIMEATAAPLTLELRGNNSYTGLTEAYSGVLIFEDPITSANGSFHMNGGYIGYIPSESNKSTAQFISLFATFQNGVIGFDAPSGNTTTITDPINLSALTEGTVFIGTSSSAELSGAITPAVNGFAFTGVKGGILQVDTALSGSEELTIGLTTPMEANGSQSTVILTGDNSGLTGAVTFNSGILAVGQSSALGSGPVTVPDSYSYTGTEPVPPTLEIQGDGSVTLPNNFAIGNFESQYPGLLLGSPNSGGTLTLSGVISDGSSTHGILGIQGNVALTGTNTYTGVNQVGTIISGTGGVIVKVNNSASFGDAAAGVQLNEDASIVPMANFTLPNPINTQNNTLTLGASGTPYLLTLTGALTGTGGLTILSDVDLPNANAGFSGAVDIENTTVIIGNALSLGTGTLTLNAGAVEYGFSDPTIENLAGDSNATINLAPASTLTLDANTSNANYYHGFIFGDEATSVVKTGPGTEYLDNPGNYWGNGTTVNGGTLVAGNASALSGGTVTVNSGATLAVDSGVVFTNNLQLNSGATLGGFGTFAPTANITLANGTGLQPGSLAFNASQTGSSIGTLAIGSGGLTLGSGGAYSLLIMNAGGSPGTDYGTVSVGGAASITANVTDPFVISLVSVNPGTNQAGLATFNSTFSYSWTILSAASIAGFSANAFSFNTSAFQNGLAGGFLSIQQSGNTLVVDFTPVPEPATWALLLGGALLAGGVTIRRRRRT